MAAVSLLSARLRSGEGGTAMKLVDVRKSIRKPPFDPKVFLDTENVGRTISKYQKDQTVFAQGSPADAVFYIQKGKVKITVVSEQGKEAVVAVLGSDEFCGEGCLTGQPRRIATAVANDEMRDHAAGEGGHSSRPPRGASVFRDVHRASFGSDHACRGGSD
jgi:hypothetical protein